MELTLGIIAILIFSSYSIYFTRIIKGEPRVFEIELLKILATWMIKNGSKSKSGLGMLVLLSIIIEIIYFVLSFTLILNPVMQFITAFFAGVELYHIISITFSLKRFFSGQIIISQIFNWKVERSSAVLFFSHSLLILIILLCF